MTVEIFKNYLMKLGELAGKLQFECNQNEMKWSKVVMWLGGGRSELVKCEGKHLKTKKNRAFAIYWILIAERTCSSFTCNSLSFAQINNYRSHYTFDAVDLETCFKTHFGQKVQFYPMHNCTVLLEIVLMSLSFSRLMQHIYFV